MHLFLVRMPDLERILHLHPDRIEGRGWSRSYPSEDEIQPRDRYEQIFRAGYEAGFDRGYEQGRFDWDRGWDDQNRWRGR